jgi:hypothetical protein
MNPPSVSSSLRLESLPRISDAKRRRSVKGATKSWPKTAPEALKIKSVGKPPSGAHQEEENLHKVMNELAEIIMMKHRALA